ncbi:hypothetical protein PVAP13_2KG064732 [Panicum virgatum]|uniref:Uncharacterized protein n=1 Tax=Panicum virgatum TaxID=38727 RepID=A0A8T0W249_PANVG|nr:hypothetical protein PVAP13_2KG064732 [Panicum virgatum]
MAPGKSGSSRRDGKDAQAEYRDTRDASERSEKKRNAPAEYRDTRDAPALNAEKKRHARQDDDREDIRSRETGRSDWGSRSRRSVAGQSALVARDVRQTKRAKHYEGMSKGEKQGGSSNGVSRPSRDSLPSALRAPGQPPRPCRDLGHGVTFTLSPSPPRITGNARHAPSTAAAPEAPRDTLPTASAERLDLDLDELSTDTDDDFSIGINPRNPMAISVDVDSLGGLDALTPTDPAATTQEQVQSQADDDDRLPLSERAKKLKGKGEDHAEATKDPISLPEKEKHVGARAKAGKFALLERALKLKKKTEAYVSELVSCRPRFAVDSVRSVDSEPIDPPSLVLPKGTLEEERSAYIIRTDLARLFRLLKKEPFDGAKVVRMLKLLMGQWASMYESPLPADLELLTTRLGALAQCIENGATFEEATLDKDEQAMHSHLQRIEAANVIREVKYPTWLANTVPVKKKNCKWRMYIDFTDLNKDCPKDDFPLPRIDREPKSIRDNSPKQIYPSLY